MNRFKQLLYPTLFLALISVLAWLVAFESDGATNLVEPIEVSQDEGRSDDVALIGGELQGGRDLEGHSEGASNGYLTERGWSRIIATSSGGGRLDGELELTSGRQSETWDLGECGSIRLRPGTWTIVARGGGQIVRPSHVTMIDNEVTVVEVGAQIEFSVLVQDESGAGVEGARVWLGGENLETLMSNHIFGKMENMNRTHRTDSNGRCTLSGLYGATSELTICAEEYGIVHRTVQGLEAEQVIVLRRVDWHKLLCVDKAGQGVSGAFVLEGAQSYVLGPSADDGGLMVPVEAHGEFFYVAGEDTFPIVVMEIQGASLRLELPRKVLVSVGLIMGTGGSDLESGSAYIANIRSTFGGDHAFPQFERIVGRLTGKRFTFSAPQGGELTISVQSRDRGGQAVVECANMVQDVDVLLKSSEALLVRLENYKDGAWAELRTVGGAVRRSFDSEGLIRISNPNAITQIAVHNPGSSMERLSRDLFADASGEIILTTRAGGDLRVKIHGPKGVAMVGVVAVLKGYKGSLLSVSGGSAWHEYFVNPEPGVSNQKGELEFRRLPFGRYLLELEGPRVGLGFPGRQAGRQAISYSTTHSGDSGRFEIRMGATRIVQAEVRDALSFRRVWDVTIEDKTTGFAYQSDDGYFELRQPLGENELVVSAPGYLTRILTSGIRGLVRVNLERIEPSKLIVGGELPVDPLVAHLLPYDSEGVATSSFRIQLNSKGVGLLDPGRALPGGILEVLSIVGVDKEYRVVPNRVPWSGAGEIQVSIFER